MFRHLIVAAAITLIPQLAVAQTFARMEVRSIDSVTLSGEQFLTGDTNGKPVVLAGELRIPRPGSDRLPAVILVHGSGGVKSEQMPA